MGPTIRLEQRKCPSCAAALPAVDPAATEVVCAYCRQRFEVVRPAPREQRRPSRERRNPARPSPSPKPATAGKKGVGASLALFIYVPILVGGVLFAVGGSLVGAVAAGLVAVGVPLPEGWAPPPPPDRWVPAPGTEGHFWIDQYATPALADVDGDGRLDLLAITTSRVEGERRPWIGAYRGRDLTPIWRLGPLPASETRTVGLAVVGDRIVVQEPFGVVSIVELSTGRRVAQHALAENQDRVRLCPLGEGDPRVLLPDRVVVDTVAGTMTTGGPVWHRRPRACRERRGRDRTTDDASTYATKVGAADFPRPKLTRPDVPGYRVRDVLIDGDDGLALLEVLRGESGRLLMGFEAGTYQERWRLPVAALSEKAEKAMRLRDLGEGTVIVGYEGDKAWHQQLTAIDAKTGEVRWTRSLVGGTSTATFGDGAVWLAPFRQVDNGRVLKVDLITGEHLTLGGR